MLCTVPLWYVINFKLGTGLFDNIYSIDFVEDWSKAVLHYGQIFVTIVLGYYGITMLTSFKMLPVVCAVMFQHVSYEFEEVLKAKEPNENLVNEFMV